MGEDRGEDGVREWIRRGLRSHPDPESERHPTDEAISEIHRRLETHSVEALLELIGHEIRTPLALIEGSAGMLYTDRDQLDGEHVEIVQRIRRNAALAILLMDRLAEVRSVDQDAVVVNARPIDLIGYVDDTVELLHESVLGSRPVSVDRGELSTAVCEVDPRHVRQILFNLLANAALNTPPDAPVNISIREVDGGYEIEVRDDGHGVAPDDAEELFEKFPRLGATRQGPGVGLYVSRGLARAHGGDLEALPSEDEDGGIFVLRLPGSRT